MNSDRKFSDELERWLADDAPKSLGTLGDVFAEKSFAVAIVLLMLVSATPLPTGGITLVLQIIAVVVGRPHRQAATARAKRSRQANHDHCSTG